MPISGNVVRSNNLPSNAAGDLVGFTRQEVGWEWMDFRVRRLLAGQQIELSTDAEEMALVLLGGQCTWDWGSGEQSVGKRKDVFDGLPFALYLPGHRRIVMKATTDSEVAECRVPSNVAFEPRLVTPSEAVSVLRGGENASRQVVDIMGSEFPAEKLLAIEVYTPGGNWSSYPPHKHDEDDLPNEADLDEIYYYRLRDPNGYALQNLYNPATSQDSVIKVRDGDAVLVRDGFHPVVAGPGYDTYYLNFLAGSSRTLANTEDSRHTWIRSTWKEPDLRLPMVRA